MKNPLVLSADSFFHSVFAREKKSKNCAEISLIGNREPDTTAGCHKGKQSEIETRISLHTACLPQWRRCRWKYKREKVRKKIKTKSGIYGVQ